ncbi:uncharacterized protein LOC144511788 isoform X2 [Mustelus asterias]
MKKPATFWKPQALCCLCLVLLLPVASAGRWCNNPDHFRWLTGVLQDGINNLSDNLLPSMVKYNIFTDVNTAELTDHCFIVLTAEQLNNTLLLLMSHFGTSSYTYNQTQRVMDNLTRLHMNCYNERLQQCLRPTTKVVTACRSDLFAYFQAVLNRYLYIFRLCDSVKRTTEQSAGDHFFLKASNISVSSNCCLVDLGNGSHSNNSYSNSSTQPSSNVSTPQPFCSLISPVQTIMDYKLISNTGARSTVTSVGTEDNNVNAVTNKSALVRSMSTEDPRQSDGNFTQTEASNSETVPDILSTSSSVASPSQTISKPSEVAGTSSSRQNKEHMNSQIYLYLFIGTSVALVLACCALIHSYFKLRRLQQMYWREALKVYAGADREHFLLREVNARTVL